MYNITHEVEGSKTPWQLRKAEKFEGALMPFGSKVYYRPSAPAELQKQQKFGDKLREGLFFGYALANGGSWSSKDYLVVDRDAFCNQRMDHQRRAGIHRVKEVEIPGSRADDREPRIQFPVAEGIWKEYNAHVPSSQQQPQQQPQPQRPLQRLAEEAGPDGALAGREPDDYNTSSTRPQQRPSNHDDQQTNFQPVAGPVGESAEDDEDASPDNRTPKERGEDYWEIRKRFLTRVRVRPRTELFSPLDAPGHDKCPIEPKHLDVERVTETDLDGANARVEDAWSGFPSDAVVLRDT